MKWVVEPGRKLPINTRYPEAGASMEFAVAEIRKYPHDSCVSRDILAAAIAAFMRNMGMPEIGREVLAYTEEQFSTHD